MHHHIAVFWVHASNEARFREGYGRIAEEYNIEGRYDPKADVAALVRKFLETKHKRRWTMIIDNADSRNLFFPQDEDDTGPQASLLLKRYFPQCDHGSILMTTRDKKTASDFMSGTASLEVDRISDSEALEIIHHTLGHDRTTEAEALKLSKELEHLPLALSQALAYIHKNSISVNEYILLLENSNKGLVSLLSKPFQAVGRDDEAPNEVTAAWIISFEQIQSHNLYAAELLALMSLFDRSAIPINFIINFPRLGRGKRPDDGSEAQLRTESLGTLMAYAFITKTTNGLFDMHRLVQLVTREWLAKEGKLEKCWSWAVSILFRAYPTIDYETLDETMRLLPHVKAVLAHRVTEDKKTTQAMFEQGQIQQKTGAYFRFTSQCYIAEQHTREAYRLLKATLGAQHPYTMNAVRLLLELLDDTGAWVEGIELAQQERYRAEVILGQDHDITLRITLVSAALFSKRGRVKEAEALLLPVVEIRRRDWGDKHITTLQSMNDLAIIYQQLGRLDDAEKLQLELVGTTRELFGEEHPRHLLNCHNLAEVYRKQGRPNDAAQALSKVVAARRKVLGPRHAETLLSMRSLAAVENWQGARENINHGLEEFKGQLRSSRIMSQSMFLRNLD